MNFGWINIFGAVFSAINLIVYFIFFANALKYKKVGVIKILEIIALVITAVLTVIPVGIKEFGFFDIAQMIFYLLGGAVLSILYIIVNVLSSKSKKVTDKIVCALVLTTQYILFAITLEYWLLAIAALIFLILSFSDNPKKTK